MASTTTGMIGPLTTAEELTLRVTRRSRLSFHFNTGHVRRWLLVQLVSVPVGAPTDDLEAEAAPYTHAHHNPTYDNVVNEYWTSQLARRWY